MASKIDRTGERRLMNCGEYATIIRYRNCGSLDVKFDCGVVVEDREYKHFRAGSISRNRLGEKRLMKCGEYATIIRYGSSTDIDVEFDSGEIAKSRTYDSFKKGLVVKPKNRLGERRLMNCGSYATIIRYGGSVDIDVKFDSGEVITNREYSSFKRGTISNKINKLGMRKLMNCGEYATVIRYGGFNDIDVKFDNGCIVRNKYYKQFSSGLIRNPSRRK